VRPEWAQQTGKTDTNNGMRWSFGVLVAITNFGYRREIYAPTSSINSLKERGTRYACLINAARKRVKFLTDIGENGQEMAHCKRPSLHGGNA